MAQPAVPTLTTENDRPDPLGRVLSLGEGAVRVGAVIGLCGALLLHGVAGVRAAANLFDVENFSRIVASYVKNNLQLQIDIDTPPPPPPPPPAPEAPAPEPEPEPQVEKAPPVTAPQTPTDAPPPPPAPAEAGKVLTDPDAPVDLTGDGFVTGNGEYRGGITSSSGTAKTAVRDVNATPTGVPGGTGTAPAPPPRGPEKDLSQAAVSIGTSWSDCGFPSEADLDGVDQGVVKLAVTVTAEGRAKAVSILADPGSGFGNHARQCAMRRTYRPALDKAGQPVVSTTAPFVVRFTR